MTSCGPTYNPSVMPLYNVEASGYEILGSIPVEGSELLTRTDLTQIGGQGGQLELQQSGLLDQLQNLPIPGFSVPQSPQPARE